MSAASDDRELDEALANAALVRQRYRTLSQDEPSNALDALIRAAARDHAASRASHVPSRFATSWRAALSIAAVVVVSATVSVLVAERQGQLPRGTEGSVNRPPAVAPEEEKRTESGELRRQLPAAPMLESGGKVPLTPERPPQIEQKRSASLRPPHAASRAPAVLPESAPSREPAKQPAAAQAASQNAPSSSASQQYASPAIAAPQGKSVPADSLQDGARSQEQAKEDADRITAERPADALQKERTSQPVPPAAAKLQQDHEVTEKKSAYATGNWESDPEAWLKHIDELRRSGQGAEAEGSFRAFRERYPAYPLPSGFVIPER